ncbi:MAG: hypothetical protein Q7S33_03960 [Nanoarchaeota archaeon]|nr:hypothetical protein [Nanoarchaeota archaeon]
MEKMYMGNIEVDEIYLKGKSVKRLVSDMSNLEEALSLTPEKLLGINSKNTPCIIRDCKINGFLDNKAKNEININEISLDLKYAEGIKIEIPDRSTNISLNPLSGGSLRINFESNNVNYSLTYKPEKETK